MQIIILNAYRHTSEPIDMWKVLWEDTQSRLSLSMLPPQYDTRGFPLS